MNEFEQREIFMKIHSTIFVLLYYINRYKFLIQDIFEYPFTCLLTHCLHESESGSDFVDIATIYLSRLRYAYLRITKHVA